MNVSVSAQQGTGGTSSKVDVTIFIIPTSPATARIGISYRKTLPHSQVQGEIKRLMDVSGWKLEKQPIITDKSIREGIPPTTATEIEVSFAPQFHDNAPVLAPYLRAFQAWDRLEVLFATPDLRPYNGVTSVHNAALDVTLEKSEGIYGYLITLREHTKELPALVDGTPPAAPENTGKTSSPAGAPTHTRSGAAQTSPTSFWPYLFLITGALLTGGVGLYLLAKRHQENLKPGRLR